MAIILCFSVVFLMVLLCLSIFTSIPEDLHKKIAQIQEEKSREKYPDYWAAYDKVEECKKREALALLKIEKIKKQIDATRKELGYLPKEEVEKIEATRLYNLRKTYFYAKGAYLNVHEETEKAQKTLIENTPKRKVK